MVSRKYTSDYTLENILDKRGRLRTVSVYRGMYYRFAAPLETVARTKTVCLIASAVCILCILPPLLLNTDIFRAWYVGLPLGLSLLPVLHIVMADGRLLTSKEKITREHKEKLYDRLALWSLLLLILSGLSFVGQIVYYAMGRHSSGDFWVSLSTVGLVCGASVLFVYKKGLLMEQVPSE